MDRVSTRCVCRLLAWVLGVAVAYCANAGGDGAEALMQSDSAEAGSRVSRPSLVSQTTMLYYYDLTAAEAFYGTKLGLEKTRDFGWVKFFRTSAGAEIAIVKSGPGAYFTPQPRNAVMISLVTVEVDSWYARLKADAAVEFLVDIHTSDSAPIRNFMVKDPGGYAVEFFQWLTP